METAPAVLKAMTGAIAHRGPDHEGIWIDAEAGIVLGYRRLAILDLAPTGNQPMTSASGRYVVVYNGEIYNHHNLRIELESLGAAPSWRGHSDTEVLLAAIDHWGLIATLKRLNGMFAFALWDRHERALYLARDRLGEKPLYYGYSGGVFLFGSELKALRAHPAFQPDVNRDALTLYLRHNYVPAPYTIWRGINKLPAAHYVVVHHGGDEPSAPQCYWDFREIAVSGASEQVADGPALVDELEVLLKDAVGLRMEADVPLGAFLSGGVDSSTIVALMQAQSNRPISTFSIGFSERLYDEAVYARAVASHLGTDHAELYLAPNDALDLIPKLPTIWDEPFADSSQVPTYLLSKMTSKHVKVSLSGDGGDELFGGYARHFMAAELWRKFSRLPSGLKRLMARTARSSSLSSAADILMSAIPTRRRHNAFGDRLPKIADILETTSPEAMYQRLISTWSNPAEVVLGGSEPAQLNETSPNFGDFRQMMMYLDTVNYLPDDVLAKVDRASMAVSLEARVPFLDHRLVEFAWRLPMSAKIRGGEGKHILRQVLYRYVPRHLVDRPKAGFNIPIDAWLSGALQGWAEELLDERRLGHEGFFDPLPIRNLWQKQKSGRRGAHHKLWNILMFQAWWQQQLAPAKGG